MKKSLVVVLCILMLVIGATASNTVNAVLGTDIKVNLEGEVGIYFSEYGSPYLYNGEEYMDTHEALFIVPVNR